MSPCCANHLAGTAAFICDAPAFHHGPRPFVHEAQSLPLSIPRWIIFLALVHGRFHCRHRFARSFLRIHWSSSSKTFFTWDSRKYATHPRRNGGISPITFGSERPRPFRTISLMCALARFTEL